MNPQTALFLLAGLLVGGAASALIATLVVRSKNVQVESDLKRERDGAIQTVSEREATIGNLKTDLTALTQSIDAKTERVAVLEAEKGRLAGELTTVESLRLQVAEKDRKLDELNKRIVELESTKADLEQVAKSAEQSKLDAIAEKDRSNKALQDAQTEAFRLQMEQKDRNIADVLREKDRIIASAASANEDALAERDRHLQSSMDAQADSFRARLAEKEKALEDVLREKDNAIEQQKKLLADAERVLTEKFSALSLESLKSANDEFLKLAGERFDKAGQVSKAELEKRQQAIDELMKPVSETLEKLTKQHKEIEERRVSAFDSIEKGIKSLSSEADQLANALRKPTSRGAWGEMNLQVILENAGLVQGEHFVMQDTTSDDEDGVARTDVVLHLPNGRFLIIDSKAPLEACWEGMCATDETVRQERFASHARLVRDHVKKLSSKAYWKRYPESPDFVIMFVPTEGAYQAAIEVDRGLIADAQKSRIYITSPMSLMSMIHAIAFVLREERLARNAQLVKDTAAELYRRLAIFIGHIDKLGRNIRLTVDNYNSAVGSLDGRVLPVARKMNALGIEGGADLGDLGPVENVPRSVVSQDGLLLTEEVTVTVSAGETIEPPRLPA